MIMVARWGHACRCGEYIFEVMEQQGHQTSRLQGMNYY
jgi:hypothetical protein